MTDVAKINVKTISNNVHYIVSPESVFERLSRVSSSCVLLESADIGSRRHLSSIMAVDAALKIRCDGMRVSVELMRSSGQAVLDALKGVIFENAEQTILPTGITYTFSFGASALDEESRLVEEGPLSVLRVITDLIEGAEQDPYSVFFAGAFGYDFIETTESLPTVSACENDFPNYLFYLAETIVVVDHESQSTRIVGNYFGENENRYALKRLEQRMHSISTAVYTDFNNTQARSSVSEEVKVNVNVSDDVFCEQVDVLKRHIVDGDVFQVVPSRTFSMHCSDPLSAYCALKETNPSPYMFYMQDEDFVLFGASPESAVKYCNETRQLEVYPIAGTRPRSFNSDGSIHFDRDGRTELDLRNDSKERAEHLMLVDLARNDIARVCDPGSRYVAELLKVDRYSHVMHLVSRVVGKLKDNLDVLHAYRACMNMGTLVGAPKIKAAELIREIEGKRRGSYGGAIGYINGRGDMDTCIIIRSAYVKDGVAYIQAGAGVVYDSVPQCEADETRSKAQSVISAIQRVNRSGVQRHDEEKCYVVS